MTRGGRNLILLGILSVVIAALTTGVSLAVYHNSGDIYLDRSRPGFLPDEEEIGEVEEKKEEEYEFPKSGVMTAQDLTEYVEKINEEIKAIDSYREPFGEEALSDEKLGITDEIGGGKDSEKEAEKPAEN